MRAWTAAAVVALGAVLYRWLGRERILNWGAGGGGRVPAAGRRDLTIKWAEAAGTMHGVAREQADSVGGLVREQAESTRDLVHEQADKIAQTAREQAEKAERAEKELAREERKAEREQARQEHDKARERYEGQTKAELSDQLEQRDLPKTGNVDELIERLIEADSK